jgi:3-dehydroquinate synthase
MKLSIHSNIRDYEVIFEETESFIDLLAKSPQSCFVVDNTVWEIYSSSFLKQLPADQIILITCFEKEKSLDTVQRLYSQLVEYPAKRNLTMISIGGGILQDISGFTASTIYRGIKWIYVPTTFLSQADSCIGSKTSLNHKKYKNLLGTFYPPSRIYIYTEFLKTLQESDFYSGFGEVIKLHLMGGRELFDMLVELTPLILKRDNTALLKSIQQSLRIKLDYMANDEFDFGRRNLLNFGHDFGHAVESTSNFDIPHGQAVILGMIAANIAARQRGLLGAHLEKEIATKLLIKNLLVKPTSNALESDAVIEAMKKDKKRVGTDLAMIMMNNDFMLSRVNDFTAFEASAVLDELKGRLGY